MAALPANASTVAVTTSTTPPTKKAKRSDSIFSPPDSVFKSRPTITYLPREILYYICAELDLVSLVALAHSHSFLRDFLADDRTSRDVWQPARAVFTKVPLPPPNPLLDGGSGCARSELDWASWVLGGGNCALCGAWTDEQPASFSLNIHICSKQECRARWRKECTQDEHPAIDETWSANISALPATTTDNMAAADIANQIEKEILDLHEGDKSKFLAASSSLLPLPALYPIADSIAKLPALNTYVISSPINVELLRQRAPKEQPIVLCAMLKADGRSEQDTAMKKARKLRKSALLKLKKRRLLATSAGPRGTTTFPPYLSELDSFQFPCQDLKDYVAKGLAFVERSPQQRETEGEQIWRLITDCKKHHSDNLRKYKTSDLQNAVDEWCDADKNGRISEVVQHWESLALHLEDHMMYARQVMICCDERNKILCSVRTQNDSYLRKQISLLKLEWRDAALSPTLIRIKNLSELEQLPLGPAKWEEHKPTILMEIRELNKRRRTREDEAIVQQHRDLYAHAKKHGLGPLPPFRFFKALPTPQACPPPTATADDDRFISLLPHLQAEIEEWRENIKAHLRLRALDALPQLDPVLASAHEAEGLSPCDARDEVLDWSTSLFCCQVCDDKLAQEQYWHAHEAFMARTTNKVPLTADRKYNVPMIWEEVIEHECDWWELDALQKHMGGAAIAEEACRTMGWQPKKTTRDDLVRLGKIWRCALPKKAVLSARSGKKAVPKLCGAELGWEDMIGHIEQHDAQFHFGANTRGVIVRDLTKTIESLDNVRNTALPNDICARLGMAHFEVRQATVVQCALCEAPAGLDSERKKFKFDGLKSHLKHRHKISSIRDSDMILLVNGLEANLSSIKAQICRPPNH